MTKQLCTEENNSGRPPEYNKEASETQMSTNTKDDGIEKHNKHFTCISPSGTPQHQKGSPSHDRHPSHGCGHLQFSIPRTPPSLPVLNQLTEPPGVYTASNHPPPQRKSKLHCTIPEKEPPLCPATRRGLQPPPTSCNCAHTLEPCPIAASYSLMPQSQALPSPSVHPCAGPAQREIPLATTYPCG